MVDQDVTNRSIISFKIAKNGQTLTNDQLKKVYEHLCLHGSKYFPKYERLSTGQPVTYESYSFLRVALGSTNIRKLIEENHDLSDDFKLIDVIEQITNELC